MIKGFKNFVMRGDVIVVAVGLAIALAFSTVIKQFTSDVITPLVTRAQGQNPISLGVQLGKAGNASTFINLGDLVSAIVYFIVFMMVVYFVIVVPYRALRARQGQSVFGEAPPTKTCPACLSDDLPVGATRCKYCTTELQAAGG